MTIQRGCSDHTPLQFEACAACVNQERYNEKRLSREPEPAVLALARTELAKDFQALIDRAEKAESESLKWQEEWRVTEEARAAFETAHAEAKAALERMGEHAAAGDDKCQQAFDAIESERAESARLRESLEQVKASLDSVVFGGDQQPGRIEELEAMQVAYKDDVLKLRNALSSERQRRESAEAETAAALGREIDALKLLTQAVAATLSSDKRRESVERSWALREIDSFLDDEHDEEIDERCEGLPESVAALVREFAKHPVGKCDRCQSRSPLSEGTCAWGCNE